jgi:hypothetical protein
MAEILRRAGCLMSQPFRLKGKRFLTTNTHKGYNSLRAFLLIGVRGMRVGVIESESLFLVIVVLVLFVFSFPLGFWRVGDCG